MKIEDQLLEQFSKAGTSEWQKAAAAEINGADAFESLKWRTSDAIALLPYYDSQNLSALDAQKKFHFPDQSSEFHAARSWKNIPHITVANEGDANVIALDHLKNEADGILFSLSSDSINFHKLLDKIEWPHCSVYFNSDRFPIADLQRYLKEKKWEDVALPGAIFQTTSMSMGPTVNNALRQFGYAIKRAHPTDEISSALKWGVDTIQAGQVQGLKAQDVVTQIAFSVSVTSNFLTEISKLKALRILWYQVARAFGLDDYRPENLLLHTRAEVWSHEKFQPHGNLIKSTMASMAAVAGGTDAHTVYAEHENDPLLKRMARNNSILLKDESHFGKVSDPVAGSFAIENMVSELAKSAWKKFQDQIQ